MPMFIRYDCVIDSPLRALIERLDDHELYDASTAQFRALDASGDIPDAMFIPLQLNVPIPGVHAATVDTSDAEVFPSGSAYGYYIFNGSSRVSDLQSLSWSGPRVVLTIDGRDVYAS